MLIGGGWIIEAPCARTSPPSAVIGGCRCGVVVIGWIGSTGQGRLFMRPVFVVLKQKEGFEATNKSVKFTSCWLS